MTPAGITTPRFTVRATDYVNAVARRRLWSIAWLPALLIASAAIVGAYDTRFLYVALMLLFIVYPMVLSLTWLAMAAHSSMRWLLRPQTWTFGPDGNLTIVFYTWPSPDDDDKDAAEPEAVGQITLDAAALEEATPQRRFYCVPAPAKPLGINFLLIPTELWPDLQGFKNT